ncbi:MAG: DMT family transporter [Chloroflexota bacterium]
MTDARNERFGVLAAVLAAVLFGTAYPVTAIALRSFQPLALGALIGTVALIAMLVLVGAGLVERPHVRPLNAARLGRLAVIGLFGGIIFTAAINIAVGAAGPTITSFIATLYAAIVTILAVPLLGERVRPLALASLVVALVGTALLAGYNPVGVSVVGTLMAFAAAIAFALYLVLARRWRPTYQFDGSLLTLAILVGRGPVLLLIELAREPGSIVPASPSPESLIALGYLVVGPNLIAQLAILASVKRVPAQRTSAALLIIPLVSAALAAILLGEVLAPVEIAGAVLVLAGMAGASGVVEGLGRRRPTTAATAAHATSAVGGDPDPP